MLEDNVPAGLEKTGAFLRERLNKLAEMYRAGDFVKFDHDFLYNIYRGMPEPPKTKSRGDHRTLSQLFGKQYDFRGRRDDQGGFRRPQGGET